MRGNPFVAVAGLTKTDAVLVVVLVAVVVQSLAANVTNVYTAGLSLVNSVPALGRLRASVLVAGAAIALSGFPDFVDHAQKWIVHLGNVAAPLTGVILADYLIVRRRAVDVAGVVRTPRPLPVPAGASTSPPSRRPLSPSAPTTPFLTPG